MQFFIIILALCLVVFLFSVFTFAHDDFILLRRNVTMEDIFNHALISAFVSLIFARTFYVLLHPRPVFLNPLGFILFPYFPGLSFLGGLIGGLLVLVILSRKKNYPIGRVFDFFSISLLAAMPFGFIGFMFLSKHRSSIILGEFVFYLILLFVCLFILMPRFVRSGKEDGVIGFLFLISFSIVSMAVSFISKAPILSPVNFITLLILLSSTFLLIKQAIEGTILKK